MRIFLLVIFVCTTSVSATDRALSQFIPLDNLGMKCAPQGSRPHTNHDIEGTQAWDNGHDSGYCWGYIEGVIDAMEQDHESRQTQRYCPPQDKDAADLTEAVLRNFSKRKYPMQPSSAVGLVTDALEQEFPCR